MNESITKLITKQAVKLSIQEHIELIEKLTHQLKEKSLNMSQQLDWKDLYGLGKGIWDGEDAQKHINRLREDRI